MTKALVVALKLLPARAVPQHGIVQRLELRHVHFKMAIQRLTDQKPS